jgi:hypothetical protein
LDAPWSVAVSDLIYPETTGTRPEHFEQSMKFGAGLVNRPASITILICVDELPS